MKRMGSLSLLKNRMWELPECRCNLRQLEIAVLIKDLDALRRP